MDYCGPIGLPHSHFLSWDEEDQDKAIAWKLYKASLCPHCGSDPNDWIGEDMRTLEPPPYKVETVRCYGCVSLKDAHDLQPKDEVGYLNYLTRNTDEPE